MVNNKKFVKVLFEYTGQREDELTIKPGDLVEVRKEFADSWWEGALGTI